MLLVPNRLVFAYDSEQVARISADNKTLVGNIELNDYAFVAGAMFINYNKNDTFLVIKLTVID